MLRQVNLCVCVHVIMLPHAHLAFRSDIYLGVAHFFGIFWEDFLSHLSTETHTHSFMLDDHYNFSTPTSFHFSVVWKLLEACCQSSEKNS